MKIIKNTALTLLALLLILSPILTVFGVIFLAPPVYSETFFGALDGKLERLTSIEEEKIVVIGGSSVAFGLDSELLEEELGMPVVNFGLYAAIGTKAMLDLSRAGINEGDIVVLAPELDAQTLSLYFSSSNILASLDDDYSMLRYIPKTHRLSLLGASFEHASNKLDYLINGLPESDGVYSIKSFNKYWDIKSGFRENNVMPLYYDPSNMIDLSPEILSDEFADYLNEYIAYCEERGATVYFSYCPINELAIESEQGAKSVKAFEKHLKSKINCEFISTLGFYVMDAGYFYDTNYHLNDAGVLYRTAMLAEDLLFALDRKDEVVDIVVPPPPPLPERDTKYFGEDDPNAVYFTYEQLDNGAMVISGLTELGRAQRELTVPLGVDGYKVMYIGANAFSGGTATSLVITEDTSLRGFLDGSLADCKITDIYIYYNFVDANGVTVEEEKLSPAAYMYGKTIHVPRNSPYFTHYDWKDSSSGFTLVPME